MRPSRCLRIVFLLLSGFAAAQVASGGPGITPHWTNGAKTGVGTSNTLGSKVWFTLGSDGTVNEVYYPTIDKANTADLEMIVPDGATFAELEDQDTTSVTQVPDDAALVFRQVNTSKSGRYSITKTYISDPERDVLLVQVQFKALKPMKAIHLYVFYDPAINNSGMHD